MLNADFDFSKAPADVKAAFRGEPKKVELPTGTRLFRGITTEIKNVRDGNNILGPWWFDIATQARLAKVSTLAKSAFVPAIQSKLAVTKAFSADMQYLSAIILTQSVYGWRGAASGQNDKQLGVLLPGGFEQIFIPNLAPTPTSLSSPYARMEAWSYIGD